MSNGLITRCGDYCLPWYQLRGRGATFVTADDTALALGTSKGDWANKPAEPSESGWSSPNCVPAVAVNVPKTCGGKISTVEIIAYGTDTANQSFAWTLYAYRSVYSPAIRIATGTAILGTMDVVTDPVTNAAVTAFYVDTWGITSDYWGQVAVKDDADNACSRLLLDFRGYQYLYLELPTILSVDTAVSVAAAFSGV